MRHAVVVLAVVGLFAGAALARDETARRTRLGFARLEPRSLGVAAIYNVIPCGTDCTSYRSRILVTSDGKSWRDVTPPHLLTEVQDVRFATPRVGWVVANDCAAGSAFVYRTTSGGRTWRRARVPAANCSAGSRLDLSFADPGHGWILNVAENTWGASLVRTRDGGRTWSRVGEGALLKGAIAFATSRNGWLARSDIALAQELYATRDSGRSWHRKILGLPRAWRFARAFPDRPTFFGARGVLPVDLVRGGRTAVAFYVTADGGRTWRLRAIRRVSSWIAGSPRSFVRYVPTSIPSPWVWWVAGGRTRGVVALTTDAGDSWHVATAPVVGWEISASDSERAWLTSERKGVYETSNGGRAWHHLEFP
jgi:photosystem II stability/assembly factor-like uncharacterized protein